ncbi:hypothetical protein [Legionella quateirensis]|uniref:Coiled-coil protein n=1 Tax=Legionella quateirensis TaxID=45072 RepID=A0A378KZK8_9GAMM|nr:hypothetical protein [Legionella quateirensis]KTD46264.1 coiled-coil protein [Legionella quateirensis]STY18967.1 coiled-coil protein [Legionella quateirensis]
MPNTKNTKKSPKGFVAIDLDGTALVQKIDKQPLYGLTNAQSNIREALITYIKAAQDEGYDIVILTARPELVEPLLGGGKIGTKATQEIKDELAESGVIIKEVYRAPAGLKGGKMDEILQEYPEDAVGILFDDQLKQVNDVKELNNPRLMAYDINSKKDIELYLDKIALSADHPHHPSRIVETILNTPNVPETEGIKTLNSSIQQLHDQGKGKEAALIESIVHELCIRSDAANRHNYKPEQDLVTVTTQNIQILVNKLIKNEPTEYDDIIAARNAILADTHLVKIKPNSNFDVAVKAFLEECTRTVFIRDLKQQCSDFQATLGNSNQYAQQREMLGKLMQSLDKPDTNQALLSFSDQFKQGDSIFKQAPNGDSFIESVRSILAKAPIIGVLFKSDSELKADKIDHCVVTMFKNQLVELKNGTDNTIASEDTEVYQRTP